MARPKKLTKQLSVDVALRSHRCHSNKSHLVQQGQKRLKVIEGRSTQHYCIECAKKFLNSGISELNEILSRL